MVLVDTALALLCFAGQCYPALVGQNTPHGTFKMTRATTAEPGYGGDVLVFEERSTTVLAVHRVWVLNPKQNRAERLVSGNASDRIGVTNGCVNVSNEVYDLLRDCCTNQKLVIK